MLLVALAALASIEQLEPTTAPHWAILAAAAAAMYPLGVLLPCGKPGEAPDASGFCNCCCPSGEALPDRVLIEFDQFSYYEYGPPVELLGIVFTSCFGAGASAAVVAVEDGVIVGVELVDGGEGYSVYARQAPVGLSVGGGSGSGATFQVTMSAQEQDECGLPYWPIASVNVVDAGSGYSDGDTLTVSLGDDESESAPASLTLVVAPGEPDEITAGVSSGFGAVLEVALEVVSTDPSRWGVGSVTVVDGGEYYYDGEQVTFTAAGGSTEESPASATIRTRRDEPPVVFDYKTGPGSGAAFSVSLQAITVGDLTFYEVSSASATTAGTGYETGRRVFFRTTGPLNFMESQAEFSITADPATGAITALTKISGGRYWRDSGVIESVVVSDPGAYYGPSTLAGSVTVNDGGRYYKHDFTQPPITANVQVDVTQFDPSNGFGAHVTAVVDDDVESATFGQITSIAIEDGGSGYTKSARARDYRAAALNGQSGILDRASLAEINNPYFNAKCAFTSDQLWGPPSNFSRAVVIYRGRDTAPLVTFWGGLFDAGNIELEPATQQVPCADINFTAAWDLPGFATVSAVVVEEE